jgi:hypothetical protein
MSGIYTQDPLRWATNINKTVYKPQLIKEQANKPWSSYYRELTAKYDFIANRLTYGIAKVMTSESFIKPEMKDTEHLQEMWRTVFTKCLIHGHCVVEVYDAKPYWQVFSGQDIAEYVYDDALNIASVKVAVVVGGKTYNNTLPIDNVKAFWFEFYHERDWKGQSILYPIWDQLIYTRNISFNMCQYDMRMGSGFPDLTIGKDVDDSEVKAIKLAVEDLDSKNAFIHPEGTELKFMGTDKATAFPEHLQVLLEQIAGGCGFPKAFLNGEAKGAVLASEEEGKIVRSLISQILLTFADEIEAFYMARYSKAVEVYPQIIVQEDEAEYATEPTQT